MAALTTANADKTNRMNPTTQEISLGTTLKEMQDYAPVVFTKAITADASTALTAFTAPFAMKLLDVIVVAKATSANGALQPLKGSDGIATTIPCATDGAVSRMAAGVVVANDARLTLAAGDLVKLIATGDAANAVRGFVTFIGIRV